MQYDSFEVSIGPGEGHRYPARAESSTAGETGTVFVTIDPSELRADIEALVQRRVDSDALKQFGARLYDLLVPAGPIRDLLNRSLGKARAARRSLRILLAVEPSELAVLPWEYLYEPQRRRWFATSAETLLVRYPKIPVDLEHFCVRPPLRMLFVAPASSGLASERERDKLLRALRDMRGVVELHSLDRQVTVQRIRETLNESEYHVVHFVGHASFRQNGKEQGYVWVDGAGGGDHALSGEEFAALFNNQNELKLVFLNACEGATVSSVRPLIGIAPELLLRGVPSVVGLQFRVFDDVAIAFAREFYASLFRGSKRGLVDVAITEARNHLATEFGSDIATVRALGEPVLFLHANEGMLFLVQSSSWTATFNPAEQQLNQYAERLVRDPRGVSVDAESRKHVLRYVRRRTLLRRAVLVALTLVLSSLAARGALRVLGIDRMVQDAIIAHIQAGAPPTSGADVVVITPDADTWDIGWREKHARLIDQLTDAGVALIVFDIEFYDDGDERTDAALAAAMARAREQGIHIIVVADDLASSTDAEDGEARHGATPDARERIIDDRRPHIASALREHVSGSGVSFVPTENERIPEVPRAALWFYAEDAAAHELGGVPGLAFAAFCRWAGVDLRDPADVKEKVGSPDHLRKQLPVAGRVVSFTNLSRWKLDRRGSRIRVGDTVILCPYRIAEHERVAYEAVLAQDPSALEKLRGKVVFVGQDRSRSDQFLLSDGRRRSGVRFHADIFLALQARAVGRMPTGAEFVLLLLMATVGALVGGASQWSAARRWAVAGVLLVVYGLVAVLVMVDTRLIFDASYPAAALLIMFLANTWIEQRWYPQVES